MEFEFRNMTIHSANIAQIQIQESNEVRLSYTLTLLSTSY